MVAETGYITSEAADVSLVMARAVMTTIFQYE